MKHYFQQFAASTLRSAEYQQSILQSVSAMDVFGGFIKGSPDGACGRMVSLGSLRGALRLQIIELLATTAMRAQIWNSYLFSNLSSLFPFFPFTKLIEIPHITACFEGEFYCFNLDRYYLFEV